MNELSIVVFVLSFFVALFILERLFPLRSKARPFGHLIINGIFTASLVLVAFFLVRPIIRGFFTLIEEWNFGLIPWLNWPLWLEGVLGFLLLDLSVYYWHRANHMIPLLWRSGAFLWFSFFTNYFDWPNILRLLNL